MNNIPLKVVAQMTREDCVTVLAMFPNSEKTYTFLCPKPVADTLLPGDMAIGDTINGFKAVEVVRIDDDCDVDLDKGITQYTWLFQRIQVLLLEKLKGQDEDQYQLLRKQQRQAIRQQAIQQVTSLKALELEETNGTE